MNPKLRRIAKLLTIKNYRELIKTKEATPTKVIKSIIKKGMAFVVLSSIIACSPEKKTPTQTQNQTKEPAAEVETNKSDKQVILFYGNSLTAGYGLDPAESFPSNIESKIDSLGLPYTVVNAGLSGETTSGGLKRLDWVMKQDVDIFVLELGANDMLRGLPLEQTRKNLAGIIEKVRAKDPSIKIALAEMMAPPNMGADYIKEFTQIYKDLSSADDVTFIPFFLEGVAGDPNLLLPDGKHPNAAGQVIVADNIWKTLKDIL